MNEWARIVVAFWLVLACFHPALAQDANRAAKAGVVKITAQRSGAAAEVGSGFVIRLEKGVAYVLTAAHVVEGRPAVQVQFFQGSLQGLPATVVGLEGGNNPQGLALLKIEGSIPGEVRALPLDSKVELEGGEAVVAIGHPQEGPAWAFTSGTVSGWLGRDLRVQIPVHPGNSGGPVMMGGRVVALVLSEIRGFTVVLPIADAVRFARGYQVVPNAGELPPVAAATSPAAAPARQAAIAGPKPLYRPYKTGDVFQECDSCPEMVVIAPDRDFTIGSPQDEKGRDGDEGPFGPIRFAAPFAIGRFEVTRGQFERSGVAGAKGCYALSGGKWDLNAEADWRDPKFLDGFRQGNEHPVICVNWDEAQAYVKWLNAQRPGGAAGAYRLPSEAEWEYAARGNAASARFWGASPDEACEYANVADRTAKARFNWAPIHECEDGHVFTAPVGGGQAAGGYRFRPNAFGLYDMLGNAWEWTQDCYQAAYDAKIRGGSAFNPSGNCDWRVLRGGSWNHIPDLVRSANRDWVRPGFRGSDSGFRVARTLP